MDFNYSSDDGLKIEENNTNSNNNNNNYNNKTNFNTTSPILENNKLNNNEFNNSNNNQLNNSSFNNIQNNLSEEDKIFNICSIVLKNNLLNNFNLNISPTFQPFYNNNINYSINSLAPIKKDNNNISYYNSSEIDYFTNNNIIYSNHIENINQNIDNGLLIGNNSENINQINNNSLNINNILNHGYNNKNVINNNFNQNIIHNSNNENNQNNNNKNNNNNNQLPRMKKPYIRRPQNKQEDTRYKLCGEHCMVCHGAIPFVFKDQDSRGKTRSWSSIIWVSLYNLYLLNNKQEFPLSNTIYDHIWNHKDKLLSYDITINNMKKCIIDGCGNSSIFRKTKYGYWKLIVDINPWTYHLSVKDANLKAKVLPLNCFS